MGYTTEFEGEFHCYRPENDQLAVFLKAVREQEPEAMAPLADWLIDQGDPRGEVVARLLRGSALDLTAFWRLFGLRPEHAAYLRAFSGTRRMKRDANRVKELADPVREAARLPVGSEGAYFVGGGGVSGQGRDESIIESNEPPEGQPGLWCKWSPNAEGTAIVWNGAEKFYDYVQWLHYLIKHFLGPWGYLLNGSMTWQGEEDEDTGVIVVTNNKVATRR
jgi:hypothetical protein